MTREANSIEARVLKVFREVFADGDLTVTARTTAADVPGWDSFNHVNLILGLEEEFAIGFTTREIGSMTCVGDLYAILTRKTGNL